MIRFWHPPPTVTREEVRVRRRADNVLDRITKLGERTGESMKEHLLSQEKNHYSQNIFGVKKHE